MGGLLPNIAKCSFTGEHGPDACGTGSCLPGVLENGERLPAADHTSGMAVLGTMVALHPAWVDVAVEHRIGKAWANWWMNRSLLANRRLTLPTRWKLLACTVWASLSWQLGCLPLARVHLKRLNVTMGAMVAGMLYIPRRTGETYIDFFRRRRGTVHRVYRMYGESRWSERYLRSQWRWAGHLARLGVEHHLPVTASQWNDQLHTSTLLCMGVRRPQRGRPPDSWEKRLVATWEAHRPRHLRHTSRPGGQVPTTVGCGRPWRRRSPSTTTWRKGPCHRARQRQQNGEVRCSSRSLAQPNARDAQIQVIDFPSEIKVAYSAISFVRCGRTACRVSALKWKMGKETAGKKMEEPHALKSNDMAQCSFQPQQPLGCDTFKNCKGPSRVAFMDGTGVVMLGKMFTCERGKKTDHV